MNIFGQRDPKWGKDKMGNSGLELEDYGCLCTSISMLDGRTPKEVNKIFSKGGAYNSNGILNHAIASKLLGLEYTGFSNSPDFFPIIAEVDMSPSLGKQQHFVVQINAKEIADAWTGTVRPIKTYPIISYRKYKNLKDYQGINEDMKTPTKLQDEITKYQEIVGNKYKFGENLETKDLEELKTIMSGVRNKYLGTLDVLQAFYNVESKYLDERDKALKQVETLEKLIEEKDSEIERLLDKIGKLSIGNEQYLKDMEDQEEVLRDLKLQVMELKKMNDSYKEMFEKPAPSDMLSIFKKIFRK